MEERLVRGGIVFEPQRPRNPCGNAKRRGNHGMVALPIPITIGKSVRARGMRCTDTGPRRFTTEKVYTPHDFLQR